MSEFTGLERWIEYTGWYKRALEFGIKGYLIDRCRKVEKYMYP
jgi:hypothetical protein